MYISESAIATPYVQCRNDHGVLDFRISPKSKPDFLKTKSASEMSF